jgi:hypothetical protein
VRSQLTFHLAETLDDVMEVALTDGSAAAGDGASPRRAGRKRTARKKVAKS